ncbi:peroxisomal assembly protein [Coemansia biformis]|uniref:Peroxisomal assembly protein n=1 Tax=Coemansia biformis TaxID=1286918 RepID=A0A9W7YKD1_9FUNG|nr:peroxisomal assembly protein [Coemansia biformis]
MPSFWTADAPHGQLRVRIRPEAQPCGQERCLAVPGGIHAALRLSLRKRQSIGGDGVPGAPNLGNGSPIAGPADVDMYASVVAECAGQDPCVVRVIIDGAAASARRSADGAQPVCVAKGWAFAAIFGRGAEDADDRASLAATVEPIVPAGLTEIVLGVDGRHYAAAQAAQSAIARQIAASPAVYHPGLVTTFRGEPGAGDAAPIALECLMCQPVSQGIVARGSSPRIIIAKLPPQSRPEAPGLSGRGVLDSRGDPVSAPSTSGDCDAEQWDLGAEWFILGDVPLGNSRDMLVDAAFGGLQATEALARPSAAVSDTVPAAAPEDRRRVRLPAIELAAPPDSSRLAPDAYPGEDPENRGFLPLASLAKAGIVSGSWVLIAPAPTKGTAMGPAGGSAGASRPSERAIRVFGCDSDVIMPGTLALPPVLFHNVCLDDRTATAGAASHQPATVDVLVTPLGSPPPGSLPARGKGAMASASMPVSERQLPLGIARKVVLARISSPLSERRDLEEISLAALRDWLLLPDGRPGAERPLRVVKTGDLIAVRIALADAAVRTSVVRAARADGSRRALSGGQPPDQASAEIDPASDLVLDDAASRGTRAGGPRSSGLVFYRVAHAEGFRGGDGPRRVPSSPSEDGSDASGSEVEYDSSGSDDGGEYDSDDEDADPPSKEWAAWRRKTKNKGLIIQPDVTMVSQTGAAHGFAPYNSVGAYMAAASGQLGERNRGLGPCAGAAVPYAGVRDRLLRLARASLHTLAVSRGLTCAVLLKGNPGTGKRHLVRDIADELGAHLYEISCFDILSDSEDKTAQVLRMYFQNARRYAPCVFHLRSVDALAQATSAPPGQEPPDNLPIARVLEACIAGAGIAHRESGFPTIVVATSSHPDGVPTSLAAAFRHEIELPVPDEGTRLALLARIACQGALLAADVDMAYIAQQTASFVARDLELLVRRAEGRAWRRVQAHLLPGDERGGAPDAAARPLVARGMLLSGVEITSEDLLGALGDARASISDTLGVPKIPNVKWEDVGGLADAKKDILDTIRLPMEQPHLFASGLSTRSGLLFYGPPGTGKTLLAKAIATECGLNFFSCKGPELISPYIGESEANVRRIFQRAREASPCVIFFDELDSLAPKRGQQGDSGGVMDRIVSQLLAELDGMSGGGSSSTSDDAQGQHVNAHSAETHLDGDSGGGSTAAVQVFAIGATNRPDLLDPALLRPGRFDKLVYLGVSETHDAQLNIIQALTRKFNLHPELDLRSVAEQCPFHYTGADFYALCSDALLKAMLRTVDEVDHLVARWNAGEHQETDDQPQRGAQIRTDEVAAGAHYPAPMTPQYYLDHIAAEDVRQTTVTAEDFDKALDELIPSVSADDLVRYQALRRQFDSALQKGSEGAGTGAGAPGTSITGPEPPNTQHPADGLGGPSGKDADPLPSSSGGGKGARKDKGKEPEH